MNAAKKNHFSTGLRRLITKPERIADEIGHFLNFPDLIVVREDDGIAFALQFRNVRRQIQPVVYTCAYHLLISDETIHSQTSRYIDFSRLIPRSSLMPLRSAKFLSVASV